METKLRLSLEHMNFLPISYLWMSKFVNTKFTLMAHVEYLHRFNPPPPLIRATERGFYLTSAAIKQIP